MKYIFYTIACLSVVAIIFIVTRCDENCTTLKLQQAEIQMKQAIYDDRVRAMEYQKQRALDIEKASNQVTVRRDTDQVIADRLLERGTDIGLNIGLNILGSMFR